jgi:hypothetical protein
VSDRDETANVLRTERLEVLGHRSSMRRPRPRAGRPSFSTRRNDL